MEQSKTEVIKAIKEAQNVLVTVSQSPSVDQLAAAIGMTLVLNKLGKHGSAVFSGAAPSTIEFLKPEETLEKTTDSLRDFIISLDKAKADKLRYKVEDEHVKIFITPYRTTIGQEDLIFSHGDFNVDVVLALGVHQQGDLDQAITAHGRILHDAKIVSINIGSPGELGNINLNEQNTSSLSEVMAHMSLSLKEDVFDAQIATAFLTGIVAETNRFSNEKTHPETMSVSAKLMAAGANQQLVATKLELKPETPEPAPEAHTTVPKDGQETEDSVKHSDGSLEIKHDIPKEETPKDEPELENIDEIHVDEEGNFHSKQNGDEIPSSEQSSENQPTESTEEAPEKEYPEIHSRMILDRPKNLGTLNAAAGADELEGSSDPLSAPTPQRNTILHHNKGRKSHKKEVNEVPKPADHTETKESPEPPKSQPPAPELPKPAQPEADQQPIPDTQTLESLERAVHSPHQQQSSAQPPLEPIQALNANPVDLNLSHENTASQPDDGYLDISKIDSTTGLPVNESPTQLPPTSPGSSGPPPPPVPPPMMPPTLPHNNDDDNLTLPPVNQ